MHLVVVFMYSGRDDMNSTEMFMYSGRNDMYSSRDVL